MRKMLVVAGIAMFSLSMEDAMAADVLVAYGDSITAGQTSGIVASPGYAQLVANGKGWGLRNYSAGGMSATFYGQTNAWFVTNWVAQTGDTPVAVLVAFGTNDMTGDYFGRRGTVEDFEAAMNSIVDTFQTVWPGVPIYIGGILWRSNAFWNDQRPLWNGALRRVATAQGATFYLSKMSGTKFFADGLHPTAKGHARLAGQWLNAMAP